MLLVDEIEQCIAKVSYVLLWHGGPQALAHLYVVFKAPADAIPSNDTGNEIRLILCDYGLMREGQECGDDVEGGLVSEHRSQN